MRPPFRSTRDVREQRRHRLAFVLESGSHTPGLRIRPGGRYTSAKDVLAGVALFADSVTLACVPMAELIDTLHAVVTTLPRSAAIGFEWDAMPAPSGTMVTDLAKFVLILRNLVSNAFKFTAEGRVIVRLRTDETRLILAVADTGIGIAAGNLPVIFDMFRQLDNGAARRGGVGLGLYIVQQMVQRLNGRITVDSRVGKGSEFRVTLPGYEADAHDIARGAA